MNGNDIFEVEEILDKRIYRRKLQYLIKWKGYAHSEKTWENACNVYNDKLIETFEEKVLVKKSNFQKTDVPLKTESSLQLAIANKAEELDEVEVIVGYVEDSKDIEKLNLVVKFKKKKLKQLVSYLEMKKKYPKELKEYFQNNTILKK